LDGQPRYIQSNPNEVIAPGDLKTIFEGGLPKLNMPWEFGNLFIKFEVDFPEAK